MKGSQVACLYFGVALDMRVRVRQGSGTRHVEAWMLLLAPDAG